MTAPGHRALRRGRHSLAGQIYGVTAATEGRMPWFRDFPVALAATRGFLGYAAPKPWRLLAWVLMPDHAHWLIELDDAHDLADCVGGLKAANARQANRALGRSGPLWAPAFHDHALRRDEDIRTVARYIVANPVRAGLVGRAGDYPFWDAAWL